MTRELKTLSRVSKVRKTHRTVRWNFLDILLTDKKFLEFFFKRVKLNTAGHYETEFPYISPCGRETNYIRCDDLPIVFSQLLDSENHIIEDIAGYGSRIPHSSTSCTASNTNTDDGESTTRQIPTSTATITSNASEFCCAANNTNTKANYRETRTDITTDSTAELSHMNTVFNRPRPDSDDSTSVADTALSLAYGGTLSLTVPFQPSSLCMLPESGRVYHVGPDRVGGVGLIKSSLAIELSRFFVYAEGAGESAHPVAFQWQGRTWELDNTLLSRLSQFTNIRENNSYQ